MNPEACLFVALPDQLRSGHDRVPLFGPLLVRASGDWITRFHRHCDCCPALALSTRVLQSSQQWA
jgi:hypothetical protein